MAIWFDEIHKDSTRFGCKIERTLFVGQSPFQKVTIVETSALGRALLLDDLWMCAEGEEKTYHELITHPALTCAPRIERVLIIGGGDGGTAREVLRHPEVKHVDMVEVDGMVVDASKEFLGTIGTAWNDPRLTVMIDDGIEFVRTATQGYDVIIVDGSDPQGPAVGLFNEAFFRNCAKLLSDNGVFVTQSESPNLQRDVHIEMVQTLQRVFPKVHPYYDTVTIYPGGTWSWCFASKGVSPHEPNLERVARVEQHTDVYNREMHHGVFAVPNALKRIFAGG
ncbi:MAG: polyamine aminopropyltransferase [Myxococcales bacterium]|nr:polyamine aminopropyltransferase [Myxococcales bacterium]